MKRTPSMARGGSVEALHCGKQDGNLLLAQVRVGFAQGLPGVHGQRHAAPTLLRIKKWRSYPASPLENRAQVVMNATLSSAPGSRFRI